MKARLRASVTNRLWLDTYLQWYDAFLANFHSERLGQWDAYKDSLKQLLPFFASGARRNYTKCVMWFLSELNHLDEKTEARMEAGGFVVRRFAAEYGGISPDLAIEQSMMGTIKGKTGLIRGHEFTELNYLTWLLNRPVISKVNNAMKEITGYPPKSVRLQ